MRKVKYHKILRLTAAAAVLAAFVLLCAGKVPQLSFLADVQLVPAFLTMLTAFSLGSAAVVLVILLLTWIAGRWYCALLCPLGILIDFIDLIPFRSKRPFKKDLPWVRLAVAVSVFSLAGAGINYGFLLLDPYSNFGRIAGELSRGSFACGMVVFLLGLIGLTLWKRRIFCTSLCPVGSLLNLLAVKGVFRLQFNSACVRCRKCETSCPSGAIDLSSGNIDNGRCVRCMACFDECRFNALQFSRTAAAPAAPADLERRSFIRKTSIAAGGAAAGTLMLKLGIDKFAPALPFSKIVPPGGRSIEKLTRKCTACLICVQNCPQQIIRPASGGDGPVSLDFSKTFCLWNCNMCSTVCPTGALQELTLTRKQHTRIAAVAINEKCIACGKCVVACPAAAITIKNEWAEVNEARCVGCGKCFHSCPVSAIAIAPIAEQQTISGDPVPEKSTPESKAKKAFIDLKECFACGSCAEVCPVGAITTDDSGKPNQVDPAKCVGCGKCVKVCPAHAITMR